MPRRKYVAKFTVTTVPLPPEMRLGWEMAFVELWNIVDEYAARQEEQEGVGEPELLGEGALQ